MYPRIEVRITRSTNFVLKLSCSFWTLTNPFGEFLWVECIFNVIRVELCWSRGVFWVCAWGCVCGGACVRVWMGVWICLVVLLVWRRAYMCIYLIIVGVRCGDGKRVFFCKPRSVIWSIMSKKNQKWFLALDTKKVYFWAFKAMFDGIIFT